jgi:hypothetical protein
VRTVIFHGTRMPDRAWANALAADVVLQPYHAIVQAAEYADWFPRARRFVYVNPTAVDRMRRSDVTDDMLFYDPADRWGLPRLRLPAALDWAVADAVDIALANGVDGLFVDDLDRLLMTSLERNVATSYVRRIVEAAGVTVYVNRAFGILDALPSLEAVLVEDVDRGLGAPGAAAWLEDFVVPVLLRARHRGVRIHRLEYGTDPACRGAGLAPRSLDSVVHSIARLPHPGLDEWSWWDGADPSARGNDTSELQWTC